MDLGTLTLKPGKISENATGRKPSDNSTAESWLADAIQNGPRAVTVPGTVSRNDNGKLIYDGVTAVVVNSLRRAVETYNKSVAEDQHIGLRLDVVQSSKTQTTVNFGTAPKIKRTRKSKTETETVSE